MKEFPPAMTSVDLLIPWYVTGFTEDYTYVYVSQFYIYSTWQAD